MELASQIDRLNNLNIIKAHKLLLIIVLTVKDVASGSVVSSGLW